MKIKILKYLALIFLGLLAASCHKSESAVVADCLIVSPLEGSIINLPDTIWVEFNYSSDKLVSRLEVSLLNADLIPLSPTANIQPPDTANFFSIPLMTGVLESTKTEIAYVKITLHFGSESKSWFRTIHLINKPLKFIGLTLVTFSGNNNYSLTTTDTLLAETKRIPLPGIVTHATTSIEHDLTLLATKLPEKLVALRNTDFEVAWTTEATLPYPEFTFLASYPPMIYYGEGNGRVVSVFASNGLQQMTTTTFANTFSENMAFGEQLFVYTLKSRTGTIGKTITCYTQTGMTKHTYPSDFRLVAGFNYQDGNLFTLFGNVGDLGIVILFDADQNTIVNSFDAPFGNIENAVKIDIGHFLVWTGNLVYTFDLESGAWRFVLETNTAISDICFNTNDKNLYIATENELIEYSYPRFVETRRKVFTEQIGFVLPRFER